MGSELAPLIERLKDLARFRCDDSARGGKRCRPPTDTHQLRRRQCIIKRAILAGAIADCDRMDARHVDDSHNDIFDCG